MIELRTETELNTMHLAGRAVATVLTEVSRHARAGSAGSDLDATARTILRQTRAKPALFVPGTCTAAFPGVLAVSVNDAIAHGAPGPERLADGDLVSIACAASVDGWCALAASTVAVGTPSSADADLVSRTREALEDGVDAARPHRRVGAISRAVGVVGRGNGYGIPRALGGHGIGRDIRAEPIVPNDGRATDGPSLRPGMVLTVAPMFTLGGDDALARPGGDWARYTRDGSRAAHFAHTVAITSAGPRVLTAP